MSDSIIEMLQEGWRHHQAGRLAEAETIYRQALARDANSADALQLLGIIAHQTGHNDAAIELLSKALQLNPNVAHIAGILGYIYLLQKRYPQAAASAEHALRLNPSDIQALMVRGGSLHEMGQFEAALVFWDRSVALQPNDSGTLGNRAATLERLGRLEESIADAHRAIQLNPSSAFAHNNLGAALMKSGRPQEAKAYHRRALELQPDFASAWDNLCCCHYELMELEEAEAAGRRAHSIEPRNPEFLGMLGATLADLGKLDEAASCYAKAIELLQELSAQMRASHQDDREVTQTLFRTQLMAATLLPTIYDSTEHLTQCRRSMIESVKSLRESNVCLDLDHKLAPAFFALAYHGQNDVELQRDLAKLMHVTPSLPPPARNQNVKIRVAFISRFLRNHTIGRLNYGLIEQLNRDEFDVTVFPLGTYRDEITDRIQRSARAYIPLPPSPAQARKLITEQRPDILFYTDLGMEPITYSLAFSRLARVQCVTWGHPITTGIDAIDYFVSSKLLEVEEASSHYTEQLIRLNSLAVYYERPELRGEKKTRANFGLPADANIYGCLQSLQKYHPEFDAFLKGVLKRDPRGHLVVMGSRAKHWQQRLADRWKRTLGDAFSRVQFLPQMTHSDFLWLTSLCDVMLDPIHFGGGNTSYEAFAFGVPTVTWPSQFLRGRIALAQWTMMGLDDGVANTREEYIERAVAIGSDAERRRSVSEKILAANSVLYENPAGVRELEAFFKQRVESQ